MSDTDAPAPDAPAAPAAHHFPGLYPPDGQHVFDRATSVGEEWRVDETAHARTTSGAIPDVDAPSRSLFAGFVEAAREWRGERVIGAGAVYPG